MLLLGLLRWLSTFWWLQLRVQGLPLPWLVELLPARRALLLGVLRWLSTFWWLQLRGQGLLLLWLLIVLCRSPAMRALLLGLLWLVRLLLLIRLLVLLVG